MPDGPLVTSFGFQTLAEIKRPFSVLSNKTARLNSSNVFKNEHIDRFAPGAKNVSVDSNKENERKIRELQKDENQKKPGSVLSYHSISASDCQHNEKNFNKILYTRDGFPDKLITKEGCKTYLKNLRSKQEDEKNYIISLADGMKNENKHKFEFYLHQNDKPTLKTKTAIMSAKSNKYLIRDAFEEKHSVSKENRAEVFPKLLNSIRMTNFTITYNDKKRLALRQSTLVKTHDETCDGPRDITAFRHITKKDSSLLSVSDLNELVVPEIASEFKQKTPKIEFSNPVSQENCNETTGHSEE